MPSPIVAAAEARVGGPSKLSLAQGPLPRLSLPLETGIMLSGRNGNVDVTGQAVSVSDRSRHKVSADNGMGRMSDARQRTMGAPQSG